jgi:twitching motility protein PilT
MATIDGLLGKAVGVNASDLHICAGSPLIIRQYGQLRRSKSADFTPQQTEAMLFEILTPEQRATFDANHELDFAYDIPGVGRFRANAYVQRKGIDLVFRVVRGAIPSFAELGIPEVMKKVCENHQGLILVTGAAGSGKSTTLAAMVDLINSQRAHHVLTVEDPIEFVHPIKKGAVNQRQINAHTRSYANALRAALREDPDVIMVGELRDLETITLAISASETGHLVIGSMNTSSASKTIDKIIDSYPPGQQNQIRAMLGESLKAVFTQRLLLKADNSGMVMAHELLMGSRQLANLIKDGKTFQIPNIMQMGKSQGMRTMDDSLLDLVKANVITGETAVRNATNLKLFAQWAPKDLLAAADATAGAAPAASGAAPAPGTAPAPGARPAPGAAPGAAPAKGGMLGGLLGRPTK